MFLICSIFHAVTPPSNFPERTFWLAPCFYLKTFTVTDPMRCWKTFLDGQRLSEMGDPMVSACLMGSTVITARTFTASFPCKVFPFLFASWQIPKTISQTSQREASSITNTAYRPMATTPCWPISPVALPAWAQPLAMPVHTHRESWEGMRKWSGRPWMEWSIRLGWAPESTASPACPRSSSRGKLGKSKVPWQRSIWATNTTHWAYPQMDAKPWWAVLRAPSNQTASPIPQRNRAAAKTLPSHSPRNFQPLKVIKTLKLVTGRNTNSLFSIRAQRRRRPVLVTLECTPRRGRACLLFFTMLILNIPNWSRQRSASKVRTSPCLKPVASTTSSTGEFFPKEILLFKTAEKVSSLVYRNQL